MAKETQPKRRLASKKTETLRQRADRVTTEAQNPKKRRIRATAAKAGKPLQRLHQFGKKEYHLPLPKNRVGRVLSKRVPLFPRFFVNAWKELLRVEWPTTRMTFRLTFAVFVFAIVFGTIITVVDYGLDKVFKHVFLK